MNGSIGALPAIVLLAGVLFPGCGTSWKSRHRLDVVSPRPLSHEERDRLVPLGGRVQARDARYHVLLFLVLPSYTEPEITSVVAEAVASRAGADALLDAEITYGEERPGPFALLVASHWVEVTGTPAAIRPPEGAE